MHMYHKSHLTSRSRFHNMLVKVVQENKVQSLFEQCLRSKTAYLPFYSKNNVMYISVTYHSSIICQNYSYESHVLLCCTCASSLPMSHQKNYVTLGLIIQILNMHRDSSTRLCQNSQIHKLCIYACQMPEKCTIQ